MKVGTFPDTPATLLARIAVEATGQQTDETAWVRLFNLYAPAIRKFAAEVSENVVAIKAARNGADLGAHEELLDRLVASMNRIYVLVEDLDATHHAARETADQQDAAYQYANEVIPLMNDLREIIDALEKVVDAAYWPVPSYNDILFYE